jgi:K+-transporting ATPase ATPase C chain
MTHIRPALVLLALLTLLTGLAYPLAVTGISQAAFSSQANGSLIVRDGKVIGSSLIGQNFSDPRYFWPRPSAAGSGYDSSASSGSNLGPTSKALVERVEGDVTRLRDSGIKGAIPADMVTASGSGLDPHISPQSAIAQITRVAARRGLSEETVKSLVEENTEQPFLGLFGAPAVNVLRLNLDLDEITKK